MELADIINPSPKSQIGDNDKIFVFDGQDVFLVPAKHASDFPKVSDTLGGIVAADESNNFGQIEVEDLIVAMVGIDFALKNASSGNFENAYSEKFNIGNVIEKLNENHLIPEDTEIESVDIIYSAVDSAIVFESSVIENQIEIDLSKQDWSAELYKRDNEWDEWGFLEAKIPSFNKQGSKFTTSFSFKASPNMQFYAVLSRKSIGTFYKDLSKESEIITIE